MTRLCRVCRFTLLGVLVWTAAGGDLAAQDPGRIATMSLEDLMQLEVEPVVGAAGRVQPVTEAPSAVTIITAADIRRYGYRSLADILRLVRGLYVTDDRNYSYVGARGFATPGDYNTRVLLLVDGHRVNDDIFEQAGIGLELGLDPATFERVEIIRGPASALYGTSAFFAVINVTTQRGAVLNGARVLAEIGGLGTRRIFTTAGRQFANGIDVALSATTVDADGAERLFYPEFDDPAANNGIAAGLDAQDVRGVTGRIGYKAWTVTSMFGRRTKTVPTAAFDTVFNDPLFQTVDERAFVNVLYERPWRGAEVAARAYADRYRYDAEYPYAPLDDGGSTVTSVDYGHGAWWGAELRVTRPVRRHTFTGGAEYRRYGQQDQGALYSDHRSPAWATNVGATVGAGYLQDEVRLHDRWLVNLGGRYDAYGEFGQFTPRASVVFMATPARSFKYLFGRAFRAPNAYELDYATFGVRNTDLRAETIRTHEVVWEEYVRHAVRASVSAYWNDAEDLLTVESGDNPNDLRFVNRGRVTAKGVEFEAETRFAGSGQAVVSYAVQTAEDPDSGGELPNSPRHLFQARVSVPAYGSGSSIAFDLRAMSRRLTTQGSFAPGHAVANVTYVQPLVPRLRLHAAIRNLFDTDYSDPASEEHIQAVIPQDGITARVGLEWVWTR